MRAEFAAIDVSEQMEQEARRIREQRDAQYGNLYLERGTDLRWVGEVGEIAFSSWLQQMRVSDVQWITDDAAGKPDFVIGGSSVGVKTVKRKVPPRLDYTAQISAHHAKEASDFFFFASYEFQIRRLWLLGGMRRSDFLRDARYYKAGDMVHANYQIRPGHEIYNIEISSLTPPEKWLEGFARQPEG